MKRSRKPGAPTDSYEIRWHSYADMTTPSADIMSSPDPLNETSGEHVILPSSASRRGIRSERSDRFFSRPGSPRKQTFELEVGDRTSPQRLLVTVQTEDAIDAALVNGTRRRLFQTSSPTSTRRKGERATTTTVPLRGTIEDEPTTPRRRGRPRKTNGTPLPVAGTKRRNSSSVGGTPRRPRTTAAGDLRSGSREPSAQPTPRSGKRGRPRKNSLTEPSSELRPSSSRRLSTGSTGSTGKRGRLRKSFDPEKLMIEEAVIEEEADTVLNSIVVQTSPINSPGSTPADVAPQADDDANSDIWMATLDDERTPRVVNRSFQSTRIPSPQQPTHQSPEPVPETEREPEAREDAVEDVDYGYLPPAASDVSSIDEPPYAAPGPDDTIAQGEDFSMIFMDSIPSLQGTLRSSVFETTHRDLGEEASIIVNNTLEEMRRSIRQEDEAEEEELAQPSLSVLPEPVVEESQPELPTPRPPIPYSPWRNRASHLSPRWTQSPRRANFSPLRQQVLKSQTQQTDDTPKAAVEDNQEVQSSAGRQTAGARRNGEQSNLYEDSFSEIPQTYLDTATPRRSHAPIALDESGLNDPELDEPQLDEPELDEPEVPEPELDEPEIDEPELDEPEPVEPELDKPEVPEPELDEPEIDEPELDEPELLEPDMPESELDEPELEVPELEVPEMDEPEVEEPEVDMMELEEPDMEETLAEVQQVDEMEDLEEEPKDLMEELQNQQVPEDQNGPTTASNLSVVSAGRLPTPDDTPPHVDIEVGQDQEKPIAVPQSSPLAAPPMHHPTAREIIEQTLEEVEEEEQEQEQEQEEAEEAQRAEEVEADEEEEVEEELTTHDIKGLLPEILEPRQSVSLADERIPQVEETPINQMTSPLQEPQSVVPEAFQDKLLRPVLSPIVRAGRALQSVTSDPPSPEPREHQLRSPFRGSATKESALANRGMSASPRHADTYPEITHIPPANEVYDDPFGSDTRHTGQVSFMEALSRSSTTAGPKNHISSRESAASSLRITPPGDDEMSWVVDEGPIDVNLRGDVSLGEVARAHGVDVTNRQVRQPAAIAVEDEAPQEEDGDDEMDIWEFEAQREAPRSTRQRPFGKKVAISAGRRSALPSPWMSRRMQRQQQVEKAPPRREEVEEQVDDDMTEDAAPEAPEPEEYSLLAQKQKAEQANPAPESANKAGRFELSSFFSSPAIISGKLGEKVIPGRGPGLSARTNEPQAPQEATVMPTSSMFPTIPQKQNFTPRPRQPRQPVAVPAPQSSAPTPPRMQLSHEDIERWQQETSNASEELEVRRPLLRPLPPKNASPKKSSLRSPLKPHTPGRVVDFNSSVLSPAEQAKIRHQRRLSQSSASAPPSAIRPAPATTFVERLGAFPRFQPPKMVGNEVPVATDTTVSEVTSETRSPEPAPLSRTVWTRQHWQFLDMLVQMRRGGAFDQAYERRAEQFLGKKVRSRGVEIQLERWHLDCIDAFKAEVGGWDERVLAKRLVGLMMGEESRARGAVKQRRRAMFH